MSEEEKKTIDEEKTIPRPEGYTIVKYAALWFFFLSVPLGMIISTFIILKAFQNIGFWLYLVVYMSVIAILLVIGHKITEVKVNLKITDEGLDQTRLSGSKLYPEHRLIKWEDMKHYHLTGRINHQDFLISVKDDVNFRISLPWPIALFEKQKDNWENFAAFQDDFWGIAPEHDVHRAFFGWC